MSLVFFYKGNRADELKAFVEGSISGDILGVYCLGLGAFGHAIENAYKRFGFREIKVEISVTGVSSGESEPTNAPEVVPPTSIENCHACIHQRVCTHWMYISEEARRLRSLLSLKPHQYYKYNKEFEAGLGMAASCSAFSREFEKIKEEGK